MRRASSLAFCIARICAIALAAPLAADVESDLRAELVGRAAIVRAPFVSECTDHYTDNQVVGGRISGKADERLAAGELVLVDNLKLGAFSGLDLNLSLVEPVRVEWTDGPYEVYEQRRCRVQLHFDASRDARKDRAKAKALLEAVLSFHPTTEAAKVDEDWNRRRVEPYPAGWEAKRAEWLAWREKERARRVREKLESVLAEADRELTYLGGDDDALRAFGEGARSRTSESWSDCEAMLAANFYTSGSGRGPSSAYRAGQFVAWATQLARELARCLPEE